MIRRLLLTSVIVLAGCTTQATRPLPGNVQLAWQQHQQTIKSLQRWNLSGRIAVQYNHHGGQANLLWSHTDSKNDIRLIGPWGKGLVRLRFSPTSAELTDDAGQVHRGADASSLLYETTGWIIPVQKLDTWILGLPVSDAAPRHLDKYGRLKDLEEGGWTIEYPEYQIVSDHELPRKLVLSRNGSDGIPDTVSLRLVVSQWQVQP